MTKIKDLRNKRQDWQVGDSFSINLNDKERIYKICDDTDGAYHLLDIRKDSIHEITNDISANDLVSSVIDDWRTKFEDVGTPVRVSTEIIVRRAKNED